MMKRRPPTAVAVDDSGALVTAQETVDAEAGGDDHGEGHADSGEFAVDVRVRVHAGTDDEAAGVIVDDFGASAGYSVDIGDNHIADPARRWAVQLDSGSLTFVDSDALTLD